MVEFFFICDIPDWRTAMLYIICKPTSLMSARSAIADSLNMCGSSFLCVGETARPTTVSKDWDTGCRYLLGKIISLVRLVEPGTAVIYASGNFKISYGLLDKPGRRGQPRRVTLIEGSTRLPEAKYHFCSSMGLDELTLLRCGSCYDRDMYMIGYSVIERLPSPERPWGGVFKKRENDI
jgi:hypothetical protein